MSGAGVVKSAIHWLSQVLETPAIIILIAAVAITLIELGSLIVELVAERRHARIDVKALLEAVQGKSRHEMKAAIDASGFLNRKKRAFADLLGSDLNEESTVALAGELISSEELHSQRILQVTDIIARVAPMFGLMATLIPLGPGLIALGRGDTQILSQSLLTAFDATVSGLAAAGVAYIISRVRKRWYEGDITAMEAVTDGVLANLFPHREADA